MNDAAICTGVSAGDPDAEQALFERIQRKRAYLAARYPRFRDDWDDLLQLTAMGVVGVIRREPVTHLGGLIMIVLRRLIGGWSESHGEPLPILELRDSRPNVCDQLIAAEQRAAVLRSIDDLKGIQAQILVRRLDDQTGERIRAELNIGETTYRLAQSRAIGVARGRLRQHERWDALQALRTRRLAA